MKGETKAHIFTSKEQYLKTHYIMCRTDNSTEGNICRTYGERSITIR